MKFGTALVVAVAIASSHAYGADKTVCEDGIGSQIVLDYREDLTMRMPGTTRIDYVISGPAAVDRFSDSGEDYVETSGYQRFDGTLYLNFPTVGNARTYNGFWNPQGELVLLHFSEPGNTGVSAWVFSNCRDEG